MLTLRSNLLFCAFGIALFGCENQNRDASSSEVDSIIGKQDARYVQPSEQYSGIGKVLPRVCTGWFISKTFFVTNQHCVSDQTTLLTPESDTQQHNVSCAELKISVDYYESGASTAREYTCKKIHMANQAHDFAVVEINGEAGITPLKVGAAALPGMEVFIVGHPEGRPKTISAQEDGTGCRFREISFPEGKTARDAPEPRYGPKYEHSIEHNCDTQGGNSGSPIIDRSTGAVVALHWDGWASSAWPHADANGTRTANVQIADKNNPGQMIDFSFKHREGNVGISIQDIRSFIELAATIDPQYQVVANLFR